MSRKDVGYLKALKKVGDIKYPTCPVCSYTGPDHSDPGVHKCIGNVNYNIIPDLDNENPIFSSKTEQDVFIEHLSKWPSARGAGRMNARHLFNTAGLVVKRLFKAYKQSREEFGYQISIRDKFIADNDLMDEFLEYLLIEQRSHSFIGDADVDRETGI